MRPRRVLVASCAAVLTLSACSGDPGGQDLTWEDSPLDQALGGLSGNEASQEDYEREELERTQRVEEIVATCMAGEGFEYTPMDTAGSMTFSDDTDWDTDEWVEQYGYGVTTDPWQDEQPMEPEEEWIDPNEDYLMAMSSSEQEAYYAALYGEQEMIEDDGEWVEGDDMGGVEYSWEDGGCQGRAQHEVYEVDEGMDVWEDPALAEFLDAAERLYEDVQRDPRVAEINAEWAECMADGGVTGMTTPEDAATSIYEEWDRLYSEADAQVDWENLDWEALEASGSGDPIQEFMDTGALEALREREISTAVADRACQDDLGIESRVLAVQFEYEEELVATYPAEIEMLAATLGQES